MSKQSKCLHLLIKAQATLARNIVPHSPQNLVGGGGVKRMMMGGRWRATAALVRDSNLVILLYVSGVYVQRIL